MKIKLVGASMSGGAGETVFTDISDFVGPVTIKGAMKECPRSLDFDILRTDFDESLPDIDLKLGDGVKLYEVEDDGSGQKEVFAGVIWELSMEDNSEAIGVTCYDKAVYLNYNEPEKQVYTSTTPQAVASAIISEMGLKPGKLAPGSSDEYNLRGLTAYDAIMACYSKESKKNGKDYKLAIINDEVNIFETGEMVDVVIEELDGPVEGKLLKSSYRSSLDDVVNEVKAIEDEKKDEKKEAKVSEESKANYGSMQKILKGKPTDVEGAMSGIKTEVDVECIGSWDMVTGKSVYLNSSIIQGEFYILSDEHVLDDAVHTVKMKLSTESEMDTKGEGSDGEAS